MMALNKVTPLRAAIVGTGRIAGLFAPTDSMVARTHAEAMRSNNIDIVAVFDDDQSRSFSFIEKWGGKHCQSLGKLLDDFPMLDIVVIASPDRLHAAHAAEVLTAAHPPRLLIIEKPPAVGPAELGQILGLAAACPTTRVAVNMSRRFDPGHAEAVAIIASGELGAMVSANFTYYGGWRHNGVHAVDALRYLLNDEIDVVSVRRGPPGHRGDPCLDVDAVRRGEPSVPVRFAGFNESYFQLFELEIRFCHGRLRFEDFGLRILVETVERNETGERELCAPRTLVKSDNRSSIDLLYGACRRFLDTGDSGALECVSLSQAAMSMKVIFDAINQR